MKKLMLFLSLCSVVAIGCGDANVQVSKQEEEAFRHPPSLKDAPPGTIEAMQKSMANSGSNVPNVGGAGGGTGGGRTSR